MNLKLLKKLVLNGLKYFLFFFILFSIGRIVFLISYGDFNELATQKLGLLKAFWTGARFDVSAICYAGLPMAFLWLISLFIPEQKEASFSKFFAVFTKYYFLIVLLVFLFLILVDYYFFQFFQSHINTLFFGIFNDDTSAVLLSVWHDYPIFKIILIFIAAIIIYFWYSKKIRRSLYQPIFLHSQIFGYALLLIFPLYFIGMRGSMGTWPLRRDYTNITNNKFINTLCYNAVYSLKFANSELKRNKIVPDISKELKKNGFKNIEAVQAAYKQGLNYNFDKNLQSKTAYNAFLEKHPPNVVFLQMESMSNHYFRLNNKTLNLIGELADELPNLYYFKNAMSAQNGTIETLENFLIGSPNHIVSQSKYFNTSFKTSITLPFKSKNYQTSFLTGANISWRNIDNLLANQGFDKINGGQAIKSEFPDVDEFTWGVHDEFLFKYIEKQLEQNTQKPQFIFGLTISNHTPYEIPSHYKPYPIKINDSIKKEIKVDEGMAYGSFYDHQYAATQLARFIEYIKKSPLGENTIIVASGDHNIRQVFEYNSEQGFLKRSVPILMYIPKAYQPKHFDENRLASHKDIFPTIFNLSLSNAKYNYTGDNLFSTKPNYHFGINNYDYMADSLGVLAIENNKPYYYIWKNKPGHRLEVSNIKNKHAQAMFHKMKAYKTMQSIKIFQDIESWLKLQKKKG